MQPGTKLACFLFCVSTSILITKDAAAETLNPTTSYTTLSASDVLAGKSTLHIHHHNGVHFKENSLHGVAREEGKYFVSLLFSKYGAQNKTLHRNELFDLFHHLGLNEQNGQDLVTRTVSEVDKQDSETRGLDVKGQELGEKQSRMLDSLLSNGDVSKRSIRHFHSKHTNCVTIKEILQAFHLENKDEITLTDFLYMSPAIIHQLDTQNCSHLSHNAVGGLDNIQHVHNRSTVTSNGNGSISPKVWGYSFAAVLIISLVGLLGVAVIPIMQKVFYNHLLQFLVALAVGALMGDALLHLLPHAIGGSELSHSHEESSLSHTSTIWKGLCGLMGIFFFFLMERVLTIITEANSKKKLKRKVKDSHYNAENFVGSKLSSHTKPDYHSSEEMTMIKSLKSYADEMHDDDIIENVTKVMEEESMMTNVKHGHSHHGHGHHDGPMPKSVASIAWMVILGDGIHNFSDGLAIGAAFANSVTGGFSTSIAVFCHELPHEIGDFAVLLRAGMSAKQAIVYNCVSSILCFIGMAIGVALGNISDVTLWIFACVGGIFIYIALVDMLPEMTSVETKQGENPFCHLLLQCSGMLAGSSIMLLIAIFEDDLLTALD